MLDADALKTAMLDAVKTADRCRRWCLHGAEVVDGGYRIHHNGAGSDTADQVVTNPNMTKLSPEVLKTRLAEWIGRLHDGQVTVLDDYAEG